MVTFQYIFWDWILSAIQTHYQPTELTQRGISRQADPQAVPSLDSRAFLFSKSNTKLKYMFLTPTSKPSHAPPTLVLTFPLSQSQLSHSCIPPELMATIWIAHALTGMQLPLLGLDCGPVISTAFTEGGGHDCCASLSASRFYRPSPPSGQWLVGCKPSFRKL